ncbi:MFS transporter [Brucella haematophila]|uniref:MFS transporter n=1 Tax=Brucella haematophila TaxID=419474 RepID=A0ABX1DKN4_9HYPH|nr:MFS transporter [Brucella haematophila]NKC03484.1 MFS transporter [Brucella haematophila]TMV05255.1 MFS transporter [Brucella haematophila]
MNDSCESALAAEGAVASRKEARAIPMVVYCLSLGVFALTTSELMISGMMPSLQEAFGRSIADIGNLISLYALGMMIGGPLVTVLFLALKIENKRGLLGLLIFYALAQSVAASTSNFHVLLAARVLTGMAAATSFGLMLAITAQLVAPELRGRASSLVFAGLMLCTVLGVPIATAITNAFGWRASFWSIVVLILLCALVIALKIETTRDGPQADLRSELAEMRKPKLWAAYATSALVIGSSFAVYSYLSPITVELAGFSAMQVPFLLAVYGAANIVGNYVSGRFADRHTIVTIFAGLVVMLAAMLIFALFAELKPAAILAIVMIGLTGIALNPAFVARVMRIAHPGTLVNAMHASVINIGLGLGPWIGGQAMEAGYGLHAPLWVGFAMTLAGLLTLAPPVLRRM